MRIVQQVISDLRRWFPKLYRWFTLGNGVVLPSVGCGFDDFNVILKATGLPVKWTGSYENRGRRSCMFEINKAHFGEFLSVKRRAKGFTQKELAERLFVSDKAVSKWERGISMPDISLLIPLADILEVTVTELLEGRELEKEKPMDACQVENIVKKALALSGEAPENVKTLNKKHLLIWGGCLLIAALESLLLFLTGYTFERLLADNIFVTELLGVIFGTYFWLGVKEKLPTYYDENRICAYSDGIFRMNIPGICFNNSNWPHIVKAGRNWAAVSVTILPIVYLAVLQLFPEGWNMYGRIILLTVFLAGLFVPICIAAKKYE